MKPMVPGTRAFPALVALFVVLSAADSTAMASALRQPPEWLPYRFRLVATSAGPQFQERGWKTPLLLADAGGDGVDDIYRANDHGICGTPWSAAGARKDWQSNLPVEFVRSGPCASVDGLWDLDGDGRAEVVATAGTPDGYHWRMLALDAANGAVKWTVPLPAGIDDRGDGNWDGFFRAFGPFVAHLPDGMRLALLVAVEAGYDERPRGVLALDARDGTEIWRYLTGPKPIPVDVHLVDLDGDGRREICWLGAGVSNLDEGEEVNGTRDDHAMLFVLADDGSLLWQRALGAAPAAGWLEAVDVDGDDRDELIVAAFWPEAGHEALLVLAPDGAVRAQVELPAVCQSLTVVRAGAGATAWLSFEGALRRYELAGDAILPGAVAEFDGVAQVALAADLAGDPRPELLLGVAGGWNWLLDEQLRPLALLNDPDYRFAKDAIVVRRTPDGGQRLAVLGDREHSSGEFVVESNPRKPRWAAIIALAGLAGGAGVAWHSRRRRRIRRAVLRGLKLRFLDELHAVHHSQAGALAAAEGLYAHLSAAAAEPHKAATLPTRVPELASEFLDDGRNDLWEALELADSLGLGASLRQAARTALEDLQTSVERLRANATAIEPVRDADRLRVRFDEARVAFRRLRQTVEADFQVDLGAVVSRTLVKHSNRLAELAITVDHDLSRAPGCLMEEGDLGFVVDNLVDNAARAMSRSVERRLTVRYGSAGDLVTLVVSDTGCGMTAAEAAAALLHGPGKRAGGGTGLPDSVRRLGRFRGSIAIAATAPDEGTTIVVYLPPAAPASA